MTFYLPDDDPAPWESSTGKKLISMQSCAVDPEIFKYGTQFKLPRFEKTLTAVDTGSAVKAKKASRLRAAKLLRNNRIPPEDYKKYASAPVIDVAVADRKQYDKLMKTYPEFVYAEIQEN